MNFGAVIVTYNRIDYLKESIECYTNQSLKPHRIVVVDNCSTDGTVEFLKKWKAKDAGVEKDVIFLSENQGGSGGFYAGLKHIQEFDDIDWIWVADDDAFPDFNAFKNADIFINEHKNDIDEIAAICGVCSYDGRISNFQRFRLKKTMFGIQDMSIPQRWYNNNQGFDIDMYSFVGTIMKRENLLKAGLPRKDFFIYHDDVEHALRMRKTGRIVCTTSIKIKHKDNVATRTDVSWRDYYATRNVVVMYKEHFDKWSLFCRITRRRLASVLSLKTAKIKVINDAIKDGKNGNMGVHSVYRPGWEYKTGEKI